MTPNSAGDHVCGKSMTCIILETCLWKLKSLSETTPKLRTLLCIFYRPPKDTQGFQLDELDQAFSKLGNKINTQNIIIMGDFNLPNIDWGKMPLRQIVVTVQ